MALVSFKREEKISTPQVNFRVDDIEQCIHNVKEQGCKVIQKIQEYPYGKFAQFIDPFDNPIELWEPYENEYRNMVKQEIADYKKKKSTD